MHKLTAGPAIRWPRVVGGALIATGLLGILLSLAGMIFTARAGAAAQQALARELVTLDRALAATADGLLIADDALSDAERTLVSLSATIGDATRAISDTRPTIASLQSLTADSLPRSIDSTRQALSSAQETARIADGVLGALGLFGLNYNPEVPLNEAIGEVSQGLADVPPELATVSAGLAVADENLVELSSNLSEVGAGLDAIALSVGRSTEVVEQYQEIVSDLREEVAAVARDAPGWISAVHWGVFLTLIWLALAQIALLAQGWELLGRAGEDERAEAAAAQERA